ncbi:magnesium-translocating P-type ATPase [Candidatus Peregrinibacteria bacterium]|nr:magnesium-translocating P-type ATPase [Candidatus Peregrinibacteria bacterium]
MANKMKKQNTKQSPWALSFEEIFKSLGTSEHGISESEAGRRLKEHGGNDLSEKGQRHGLKILISQFTSPLILILIGAAAIAFFAGEKIDAIVIVAIVVLSALFGFFQEYKAERSLRALKKLVSVKTRAIRGGAVMEVDAKEIVPGDIVHLNIGDIIPADIRLIHVDDFSADESSLTGESAPVFKNVDLLDSKKSLPQDLINMAFMGTTVASGLGEGIVTATGEQTFFGKTAEYLKQEAPETNFHKSIREFGNFLMKITFVMTLFILVVNAALGKSFFDSLLFAIALAVGITPEVLPMLITITLSSGALSMAKKKVIIKSLPSVEDLGNMDILCCDKTGTLTEGVLALADYRNFDDKEDEQLLLYGLLCNSTEVGKRKKSFNNVIDRAIWESDKSVEARRDFKGFKKLDDNEFDFERRRMSVVVKGPHGNVFIAKGAPEAITQVCTFVRKDGKDEKMTKALEAKIHAEVAKYEEDGYRLIAVAEKQYKLNDSHKEEEHDLVYLGLLLFLDPPKKDVKASLLTLARLGVAVKIISGDSAGVTGKICSEVGLKVVENRVITGTELAKLNDREFKAYIHKYNVFARVTPEQKYKIVEGLNKSNHVVGFLGDGINDAPALKAADVGISVDSAAGIAKQAADIILLKKNLNVLTDGIIYGRKIFENISKYIFNTISANFGNMFTVAASSMFLNFIPLLPAQILLNNFFSDMPMLTIATDSVDEHLLQKPKKLSIKMISKFMVVFGLISTAFDLALILPMVFLMKTGPELFRTAWFVESSISEMLVTFSIRTKLPFYKSAPSKWLVLSTVLTCIVVVGITYTQFGYNLFQFDKMPTNIIMLIVGVLVSYFAATEIAKRFFFRKFEEVGD